MSNDNQQNQDQTQNTISKSIIGKRKQEFQKEEEAVIKKMTEAWQVFVNLRTEYNNILVRKENEMKLIGDVSSMLD